MLSYVGLFGVAVVHIGLKAMQQLNVVKDTYLLIPPVSFGLAACEIYMISTIAKDQSVSAWLALGSGAAIGALAAMWLHKRVTQ